VLRDFGATVGRELPATLVLAAVGLVGLWRGDRARAWWLTAWLAASVAAVLAQRQLAPYHYLLVVPPLAVSAAAGVATLQEALARPAAAGRPLAGATLVAALALGAWGAPAWQRVYGLDATHRAGKLAREPYLRRLQTDRFSTATAEAAGRYLRERTRPGDGILVWGLSPGIYALADRHPVTRYPFHKLLLTEAPLSLRVPGLAARRADFLRRLHADPPAYILVGLRDSNPFEPQDSATSLQSFTELAAFVERGYTRERALGHFVLLRRNDTSSASQPTD